MARRSSFDVGLDERLARVITVACVCVPGGIYNSTHVVRLQRQIEDNLAQPFKFHILMHSDKPGWWAKIDLFEPGRFEGRVLYLDLDVTVVDDLEPLANYPEPFVAIKDYIYPTLNSSVMSWDAGVADHVHTNFTPDVMDRLHGDQDWITEQMPGTQVFPEAWCVSFRKSVKKFKHVPPDAKVVVFHGAPKPWELDDSFNRLAPDSSR